MAEARYEVVIVGGGPAGLSAALVLGRCRRRVLVCDAGQPRNAASHGLHGFLTRDGIKPAEFLEIARQQLGHYNTVEIRRTEVTLARSVSNDFELTLTNGETVSARKLLVATGVVDELPVVNGLQDFYGRSVFHCPYCDGWEVRDQPLAIYGNGENGSGLALELKLWSRDLVLCTDGPSQLTLEHTERLARDNIKIREEKIARLEGKDGVLKYIVFANGERLERRAMFFSSGHHQGSDIANQLGCAFTDDGCVATGEYEATSVPGLFAAGDASKLVQFVIVAASEGAQAAVAINKELIKEDLN
jgi:thioredoxin reductase